MYEAGGNPSLGRREPNRGPRRRTMEDRMDRQTGSDFGGEKDREQQAAVWRSMTVPQALQDLHLMRRFRHGLGVDTTTLA